LLCQDYPNFEVIVLDDGSSDATPEIVEGMAARDSRLHLIVGEPLPPDWAGKPHACHQAAQTARGDWFLFVDADTVATPDMLRRVVAEAIRQRATLLSGFPRQITRFGQKTAIPLLNFFILGWMPLWWLAHRRKPTVTFAIGQFLLFDADFYREMGGHAVVKSRIIEDVWLGVEVVRRGGRQVAVDLSPVLATSMYDTMSGMWRGIVKWTYSVAILCLPALIGLMSLGVVAYLGPFISLWWAIAWGHSVLPLIIFQVAVILFMRYLADSRLGESVVAILLHPFGVVIWVACAIWGAIRAVTGTGVSWKKRVYDRTSTIE
ncbi:MAG: glycosyltransferase family 2 protein, partial [Dehalococcoidia bacterium]|nr:glycosyltransferase family 2 protein [Dehalococcoidia bacterium]